MSDEALRRILREAEAQGGAAAWARAATAAYRAAGDDLGMLRLAASAFDRAHGLAPDDEALSSTRTQVLDRLEVREYGLTFRYVPAGPFLQGSDHGEPDERPAHEVEVDGFWITDVPVSWSRFCALLGWLPPGEGGLPATTDGDQRNRRFVLSPGTTVELGFSVWNDNKIRLQYCEDRTRAARDWHAHVQERPAPRVENARTLTDMFGRPDRDDPSRPFTYEDKPMVAVSYEEARWLPQRLTTSTEGVTYALPTEAQWEKAARGALIGRRYAWGDEGPEGRCDFGAFERFSILPSRTFPANGYGLFAVCGGVWEWTTDDYDAARYRAEPHARLHHAEGREKVLRGGSWSDCADAVTVSFRTSRLPTSGSSPNVGFRLVRTA